MSFFRHARSIGPMDEQSNRGAEAPLLIVRDESHRLSLGGLLSSVGLLKQSRRTRNLRDNGAPRPSVSRPNYALVLQRARFSSVAPGCVVKTVVTEVCCNNRLLIPFRRMPVNPRSGRTALGRIS